MAEVEEVVCYCGLYEACPLWDQMNDDRRRVCSADKRMTMGYFWNGGFYES